MIRTAIDSYSAQNDGKLPGADGAESTFLNEMAVYLRGKEFPACPVGAAKNNSVHMVSGTGAIADSISGTVGLIAGSTNSKQAIFTSTASKNRPTARRTICFELPVRVDRMPGIKHPAAIIEHPANHIAGGMYGATGAGDPYVTGAVVQGSHAGAMGGYAAGGQAAATGAGRHQFPQQQQPALLSTSVASASRIEILFMIRASLPETSVELTTAIAGPKFDASDAAQQMARVATQPYPPRMMCKRNG